MSGEAAAQREPLAHLAEAIRQCRLCRDAPMFAPPLPHDPRPVLRVTPSARIVVAGQAPGTRVHASGTPFTDPSGVRLRDWMGVTDTEFYDEARIAIVPMGFCFPGLDDHGGDKPPRRECALTWHDRLFAILPPPAILLCIGQHAQRYHLRRLGLGHLLAGNLSATVHNWQSILAAHGHIRLYPLPHPSWRNNAWLRNNPWFGETLLPVLRHDVRGVLDAGSP
ncbi:MAG: uracil-DNA glycosylase family protein [Beijerinckiaceae bacterium]